MNKKLYSTIRLKSNFIPFSTLNIKEKTYDIGVHECVQFCTWGVKLLVLVRFKEIE